MTISTADRLVQLRKDSGLSQEALAAKLGLSRQAISKWERAEATPDTDNLIALAEIYGITLDALLDPSKEMSYAANEETPQQSEGEKKEDKKEKNVRHSLYPQTAKRMFRFPYPLVIIIAYLALCLGLKGIMSVTPWLVFSLLFLTIPMYYMIACACRMTSKRTFLFLMPVPIIVITVYLFCGFVFKAWVTPLILFLVIPLYYWCVAVYAKGNKKKKK